MACLNLDKWDRPRSMWIGAGRAGSGDAGHPHARPATPPSSHPHATPSCDSRATHQLRSARHCPSSNPRATHPARRVPFFQERTPNLTVWGKSFASGHSSLAFGNKLACKMKRCCSGLGAWLLPKLCKCLWVLQGPWLLFLLWLCFFCCRKHVLGYFGKKSIQAWQAQFSGVFARNSNVSSLLDCVCLKKHHV